MYRVRGGGYIRLTNGIQICYNYVSFGGTQDMTCSYTLPFIETPTVVPVWTNTSSNDTKEWMLRSFDTTSFKIHKNSSHGGAQGVMYIAIGKWK